MHEVMTTVQTLLALCGGVTVAGGAITFLVKWLSPIKRYRQDLDAIQAAQERNQESNDKRFRQDLDAIIAMQETDKLILRTLIVMLDHNVTGNGIDNIKKVKKDIETFLISK